MDSRWFKGIPADAKEKRTKEIKSYRNAFEALRELLEQLEETTKVDYDSSSWAYKQADVNGANRKLREIKALLKL